MKRPIKFRGKCIRTGKWVYGYLSNKDVIQPESGSRLKVDPETIGQYTGSEDMNKNPICIDDVVKLRVKRLATSPWWTVASKSDGFDDEYFVYKQVVLGVDRHGFPCIKLKHLPCTKSQIESICNPKGKESESRIIDELNYHVKQMEVIGNIHDNSDPL